MIGEHGQSIAQRRQPARCPPIEAADIDDDRREIAAEQRDRRGDAAPRGKLYAVEVLATFGAGDLRSIGARDFCRRRRNSPIAPEAQPGIVLAIDDAPLVRVPVETALVLDPLADDTGIHSLVPYELAVTCPFGRAVIDRAFLGAAPLPSRLCLHFPPPIGARLTVIRGSSRSPAPNTCFSQICPPCAMIAARSSVSMTRPSSIAGRRDDDQNRQSRARPCASGRTGRRSRNRATP